MNENEGNSEEQHKITDKINFEYKNMINTLSEKNK